MDSDHMWQTGTGKKVNVKVAHLCCITKYIWMLQTIDTALYSGRTRLHVSAKM